MHFEPYHMYLYTHICCTLIVSDIILLYSCSDITANFQNINITFIYHNLIISLGIFILLVKFCKCSYKYYSKHTYLPISQMIFLTHIWKRIYWIKIYEDI